MGRPRLSWTDAQVRALLTALPALSQRKTRHSWMR